MVTFHFLKLKFLFAASAAVVLALVGSELHAFGKGAEVEVALVAGEHVGYDAFRSLDFVVYDERSDAFFQAGQVVRLLVEAVVEFGPIHAFHNLLEFLRVEVRHGPVRFRSKSRGCARSGRAGGATCIPRACAARLAS